MKNVKIKWWVHRLVLKIASEELGRSQRLVTTWVSGNCGATSAIPLWLFYLFSTPWALESTLDALPVEEAIRLILMDYRTVGHLQDTEPRTLKGPWTSSANRANKSKTLSRYTLNHWSHICLPSGVFWLLLLFWRTRWELLLSGVINYGTCKSKFIPRCNFLSFSFYDVGSTQNGYFFQASTFPLGNFTLVLVD
jgi:hypothetical protein